MVADMISRIRKLCYDGSVWDDYIIEGAASIDVLGYSDTCFNDVSDYREMTWNQGWGTVTSLGKPCFRRYVGTYDKPKIQIDQQVSVPQPGGGDPILIDIGHVLAGLDAMNHPDELRYDIDNNLYSPFLEIEVPIYDVEHNFDAATFVGDLSTVVLKMWNIHQSNSAPTQSKYDQALDYGMPPADVIGNIDAYAIYNLYSVKNIEGEREETDLKLSEILKDYYKNSTNQNLRFQKFRSEIGLNTGTISSLIDDRSRDVHNAAIGLLSSELLNSNNNDSFVDKMRIITLCARATVCLDNISEFFVDSFLNTVLDE